MGMSVILHIPSIFHICNVNPTYADSIPVNLSEPSLTSRVSAICGLQLHYGVTNRQPCVSAGSHPAVIVFKPCCFTNKHMGAPRHCAGHPHCYSFITHSLCSPGVSPHTPEMLRFVELPSQLSPPNSEDHVPLLFRTQILTLPKFVCVLFDSR